MRLLSLELGDRVQFTAHWNVGGTVNHVGRLCLGYVGAIFNVRKLQLILWIKPKP